MLRNIHQEISLQLQHIPGFCIHLAFPRPPFSRSASPRNTSPAEPIYPSTPPHPPPPYPADALPELSQLERKYEGAPFAVVGVHSAKFSAETDTEAIRSAGGLGGGVVVAAYLCG